MCLFLAIVNSTTMNVIQHNDPFEHILSIGVAGSWGKSISSYLRTSIVFHNGYHNYISNNSLGELPILCILARICYYVVFLLIGILTV